LEDSDVCGATGLNHRLIDYQFSKAGCQRTLSLVPYLKNAISPKGVKIEVVTKLKPISLARMRWERIATLSALAATI